MTSRVGLALFSLLLLIPLTVGAALAGIHGWRPQPVEPNTASLAAAPAAAPATAPAKAAGTASAGSAVDARRAAGEAQSQAGFLITGTKQLSDGTSKLATQAPKLADATTKASQGATELREGMIQLQAGTGQLGRGATELADGVGAAVDNVVGINVVRGQILTAIDSTLTDLDGVKTAEAKEMRQTLKSLRTQIETFELDAGMVEKLKELKAGSRELSNQLDVSGYAYHDGVYEATEGAKKLAAGLAELDRGVDEALKGVNDLDAGAEKIDTLAKNTKKKIDTVAGTVPNSQAVKAGKQPEVDTESQALQAEVTASPQSLLTLQNRLVSVLLAALVFMGGLALGAGWKATSGARAWIIGVGGTFGLSLAGLVGLAVVNPPSSTLGWAYAAAAFALTALASGVGTLFSQRILGSFGGMVLAAVLAVAQLGAVAWLWKQSVDFTFTTASWFGIHLIPLNWSVVALNTENNGYLWTSLGVLGGVTLCGWILGVFVDYRLRRQETEITVAAV